MRSDYHSEQHELRMLEAFRDYLEKFFDYADRVTDDGPLIFRLAKHHKLVDESELAAAVNTARVDMGLGPLVLFNEDMREGYVKGAQVVCPNPRQEHKVRLTLCDDQAIYHVDLNPKYIWVCAEPRSPALVVQECKQRYNSIKIITMPFSALAQSKPMRRDLLSRVRWPHIRLPDRVQAT